MKQKRIAEVTETLLAQAQTQVSVQATELAAAAANSAALLAKRAALPRQTVWIRAQARVFTWKLKVLAPVVGFPAELLLVIMIEKLTRFDYRPLLNVRVRNGVGDHHPATKKAYLRDGRVCIVVRQSTAVSVPTVPPKRGRKGGNA